MRKPYIILSVSTPWEDNQTFHGKKEKALLRHEGKLFVLHCNCNPVPGQEEKISWGDLVASTGNPQCKKCGFYAGIVEPQGSVVQKNILIQHSA